MDRPAATGGSDLLRDIKLFSEAEGVNAKALKNSVRSALLFFKGALKHSLTGAQVADDLRLLGSVAV